MFCGILLVDARGIMSFLQNAKIRTKILSLIIPVCAIGVGGVAVIASNYKAADTQYNEFISNDGVATTEMARSTTSLVAASYSAYQAVTYAGGSADQAVIKKAYDDAKKVLFERLDKARELTSENDAVISKFADNAKAIFVLSDNAMALNAEGRVDEAKALLAKSDPLVASWRNDAKNINNELTVGLAERTKVIGEQTNSTILNTLVALGVLFLAGIVLSLFVSARGITGPIDRLRVRMISLANGETQQEISGLGRKDEVGQMADAVAVFRDNAHERVRLEQEANDNRSMSEKERIERDSQRAKDSADTKFAVDSLAQGLLNLAEGNVAYRIAQPFVANLDEVRGNFNNSADRLQAALTRVAQNARAIDSGANEIRSAADDLAKRTEQQAASVEETAAALEQITTTVKDSTRRAQEAGVLVARARDGAEQSGDVVRKAVIAMEQIEKSSGEISNIISVIDEIAFQTNLLALNAGVEAARAGEAGKGFAVVAQEVRELAQRSANAAKDIKGLITTSNVQVQSGVSLVSDTGRALEGIISEVQEINRHVLAIVEAAQEQSTGLQQINTAVNQMDQDTQKNAAMVEESTAASHGLAQEAASLNQLLAQFKLASGHEATTRVASGRDRPAASPARALGRKVASAFSGNAALATKTESWEEF